MTFTRKCALDRLTDEVQATGATIDWKTYYEYDAASNRKRLWASQTTTAQPDPFTTYYDYDARNLLAKEHQALESAGLPTKTTYYEYDAAQRMTRFYGRSATLPETATYFSYNARDMVSAIQLEPGASVYAYEYTGAGERAITFGEAPGGPSYWAYDKGRLTTERDPAGDATAIYRHNQSAADRFGSLLEVALPNEEAGTGYPGADQETSVRKLVRPGFGVDEREFDYFGVGVEESVSAMKSVAQFLPAALSRSMSGASYLGTLGALYLPTIHATAMGYQLRHRQRLARRSRGKRIPIVPQFASIEWPPVMDWPEEPPAPPAECTHSEEEIRSAGRGLIDLSLYGRHLGCRFELSYYPTEPLTKCCREIRFAQLLKYEITNAPLVYVASIANLNPQVPGFWGWDYILLPFFAGDPRPIAGMPTDWFGPPWYSEQHAWSRPERRAYMQDYPAVKDVLRHDSVIRWNFQTCAVCIEPTRGAPASLRKGALGCVRWSAVVTGAQKSGVVSAEPSTWVRRGVPLGATGTYLSHLSAWFGKARDFFVEGTEGGMGLGR